MGYSFGNLPILIIHFLTICLLLCFSLGNRKCRKYRQNQARLCKFQVRIFKASDSPSILVECQRRTGCCIKFHAMAMKVLCAARGCEYKEECFHAYTIGNDVLEQCRLKSLPISLETADGEGNGTDLDCGCGEECDCGQFTYLPKEHDCLSEVNTGTF